MSYPHFSTDCHKHHDLVVSFRQHPRPRIACISGSMRFATQMQKHAEVLSLLGWIVVMPHVNGHVKLLTDAEKTGLDKLHIGKIDLADEVHVINVGDYIGESTRREIAYANSRGKPIRYFGEGCTPDMVAALRG